MELSVCVCVTEAGRIATRLIYLPLLGNHLTIKWGEVWFLYLSDDRCNNPSFHDAISKDCACHPQHLCYASRPSNQWFPRISSSPVHLQLCAGRETRGPLVNLREDMHSLQEYKEKWEKWWKVDGQQLGMITTLQFPPPFLFFFFKCTSVSADGHVCAEICASREPNTDQ